MYIAVGHRIPVVGPCARLVSCWDDAEVEGVSAEVLEVFRPMITVMVDCRALKINYLSSKSYRDSV